MPQPRVAALEPAYYKCHLFILCTCAEAAFLQPGVLAQLLILPPAIAVLPPWAWCKQPATALLAVLIPLCARAETVSSQPGAVTQPLLQQPVQATLPPVALQTPAMQQAQLQAVPQAVGPTGQQPVLVRPHRAVPRQLTCIGAQLMASVQPSGAAACVVLLHAAL